MIIPKVSKVKYRSTKRIIKKFHPTWLQEMQLECYNGTGYYANLKCSDCGISANCWFRNLKPYKE